MIIILSIMTYTQKAEALAKTYPDVRKHVPGSLAHPPIIDHIVCRVRHGGRVCTEHVWLAAIGPEASSTL
jgi:hypothetical protein